MTINILPSPAPHPRITPRTLCILGKDSTAELCPHLLLLYLDPSITPSALWRLDVMLPFVSEFWHHHSNDHITLRILNHFIHFFLTRLFLIASATTVAMTLLEQMWVGLSQFQWALSLQQQVACVGSLLQGLMSIFRMFNLLLHIYRGLFIQIFLYNIQ